jgi:hypothetical protein
MEDLIAADSRNIRSHVLLAGVVIFAVGFGWFSVSRQLGNMLADVTKPGDPNAAAAADLAISMAPNDPAARWLQGSVAVDDVAPDHLAVAIKSFEDAVRLSPNDYRWRVELGRAYEQAERVDQAEIQLQRAVDLAPAYALPRWHLGNFYLRQGRTDEAFAQLRKAAENDQTFREQVFSLAWDYFDKDPVKVEQLAADTPDARASLALFFAARGRASESLRIWNLLSETEKTAYPEIAKGIAQGLYIQRAFPEALEFARQLGIDVDARPGAVTNGGFERVITAQGDSRFDWVIDRKDSKLDVATDTSVKHTGIRSVRVAFRNFVKPEFYNIFQTVVVEPVRHYRLSFWVRTENLKSSGGPLLQIVNANDDKFIAESKPFQIGTSEWQEYSVEFRAPENCNAISIRTARQPCGEQCPIVGTFWYDDFELTER